MEGNEWRGHEDVKLDSADIVTNSNHDFADIVAIVKILDVPYLEIWVSYLSANKNLYAFWMILHVFSI